MKPTKVLIHFRSELRIRISRTKIKWISNKSEMEWWRLMCHCVYSDCLAAFRKFFHLFSSNFKYGIICSFCFGSYFSGERKFYGLTLSLRRTNLHCASIGMCSLFTMRMMYDKRVANAVSSIVPIDTLKMSVYLFDCHGILPYAMYRWFVLCVRLCLDYICTIVFVLYIKSVMKEKENK